MHLPLAMAAFFTAFFALVVYLALRYRTKVDGWIGDYATWVNEQCKWMFIDVSWWHCRWYIIGSIAGVSLVLFSITRLIFMGVIGLAAGALLPRIVVALMVARRRRTLNDQLVDGLIMVGNGLRAGIGLQQSLSMAARELRAPLAQEFDLVLRQNALGQSIENALDDMSERARIPDFTMAVLGITVLRKTGGNLAEAFDRIVHVLRERKRVQGKISAATAQGKMQGVILVCIPFVIVVALSQLNPEMFRPMLTTWLGWLFLGLAGLLDLIGWLLIWKIVSIDV